MKYHTFFGVDLTATEAKPSACLVLDIKFQVVYFGLLFRNSEIIALVNFYVLRVVAIEVPLSFPLGLYCLEKNCLCGPKFQEKNRHCDQELRQ